ncbi:type II toxin-antitoxin system prevent-host-death family antitoxin [Methylobacterium sp. Leaf88]|uniref:type II toxin-antitoxin system prevent-host-death family antitoxin n=2 Tax=unclassified Methylobacterium TaxID=2615210 RepID=UPI0009EA1063
MNLFKLIDTDATDFAKRAGFYQDEAIRNPVVISKNGRPKTVLVAYDEFIRLRERDRRSFTIDDIPDDIADAILSAEVPKGLTDTDERRSPTMVPGEPPIARDRDPVRVPLVGRESRGFGIGAEGPTRRPGHRTQTHGRKLHRGSDHPSGARGPNRRPVNSRGGLQKRGPR